MPADTAYPRIGIHPAELSDAGTDFVERAPAGNYAAECDDPRTSVRAGYRQVTIQVYRASKGRRSDSGARRTEDVCSPVPAVETILLTICPTFVPVRTAKLCFPGPLLESYDIRGLIAEMILPLNVTAPLRMSTLPVKLLVTAVPPRSEICPETTLLLTLSNVRFPVIR